MKLSWKRKARARRSRALATDAATAPALALDQLQMILTRVFQPSVFHLFRHVADALAVDGAEVGVLEQADKVGLRSLQRKHGDAPEAQVVREVLGEFADRRWKGSLRISTSVLFW